MLFVISAYLAIFVVPLALRKESVGHTTAPAKKRVVKAVAALVVAALAGWYLYKYARPFTTADAFFFVGVAVTLAVAAINSYWLRRPWASPAILSLFAGAAIIVALMSGAAFSLNFLEQVKSGSLAHHINTIVSKNGSTKGYVLMAGERGLLIYFPDGGTFSFQKSDEVQKIEWSDSQRP